jgi:hypothetical protein
MIGRHRSAMAELASEYSVGEATIRPPCTE